MIFSSKSKTGNPKASDVGFEVRSYPRSRRLEIEVETYGLIGCFLYGGSARHSFETHTLEQQPGTLLLRHSVERHLLEARGDLFLISIDPEKSLHMLQHRELVEGHRFLLPPTGLFYARPWIDEVQLEDPTYLKSVLHRFLKESLRIQPPNFVESAQREIVSEICRSYLVSGKEVKGRDPLPEHAVKTLEAIETNYEGDVSLKKLAEGVAMSEGHLSRSFKACTGWSVIDRLIERRLQDVRERLIWTDDPIQNVARASGFKEMPHFNRIFKKRVGMTPKVYRDLVKSKKS